MKRLLKALVLAAVIAPPAHAAPARVAAAATPGPAWWEISDGGGSTLWIMAIPDGMIMNTRWNEDGLNTRLASARLLISPLLGAPVKDPALVGVSPSARKNWDYTLPTTPGAAQARPWEEKIVVIGPRGQRMELERLKNPSAPDRARFDDFPIAGVHFNTLGQDDRARTDPLQRRLPPGLNQRAERIFQSLDGETREQMRNAKTWEAALWLDLWNWPRGEELGNPVTTRAQAIAQNARLPVETVYVPALWRPILADPGRTPSRGGDYPEFTYLWDEWPNLRTQAPEAVQQKCLERVIAETESGRMPALRAAAMQAWARGDVPNALRRSGGVQYCLMGDQPSTNPTAFLKKQAYLYIQALESAWTADGETVALVEFDALLLEEGGVLDHYRRLGYEIVAPPGA